MDGSRSCLDGHLFSDSLIRMIKGARRSALAASDVHDVLVPLYLSKQDAAKDALAKALRVVISNEAWLEPALRYFEERGSVQKFDQVIHELNALDELKARDVPEMYPRYARDALEVTRATGDVLDEIYSRDISEMYPRYARGDATGDVHDGQEARQAAPGGRGVVDVSGVRDAAG